MKNRTTAPVCPAHEYENLSPEKLMTHAQDSDSSLESSSLTWLNSREAANYLRISVATLRNMVSRRQVPYYKLGIRRLRFSLDELDQLLLKNKGV